MLTAAVYKTVIRPVLMYGCETWALRKGAKLGSKDIRISIWMARQFAPNPMDKTDKKSKPG